MNTVEGRNPPWTRDELILALELYLRDPLSLPSKTSVEVTELSSILHLLGKRLGAVAKNNYRNANGIFMKMMNFRRFDPMATQGGLVGLTRGNKEEEVVWQEFANDQPRLRAVARAIVSALSNDQEWEISDTKRLDDEVCEASEGRILTRVHVTRERNRKIVEKKKVAELALTGRLQCQVCTFDFEERYGERGRGFIEVHHIKPVHTLVEGEITRLGDLALVCANCHRMIHSARPWLEIPELKAMLQVSASSP